MIVVGRPFRTVRGQLTAAMITLGVLAITLNALLLGGSLHGSILDRQQHSVAGQAAALSGCCQKTATLLLLTQPGALNRAMQVALAGTLERRVLIVDAHGHLLYASPLPAGARATLLTRLRSDLAAGQPWAGHVGNQVVATVPIVVSNGAASAGRTIVGALLVDEDNEVGEVQWRRSVGLIVISGLVTLALVGLGGALVAGTVARPLRAMTRAARAVAAGNYTQRAASTGPAELRDLSASFNTMVGEVLHQRRIERDLLANVSHELAAPLGLIRGYAEALADGLAGDEAQQLAALHTISHEATRLGRLSGDLLDLALLESGQVSLHIEPVPVGDLISGLVAQFATVAREAEVSLTVQVAPALPSVPTDGLRLEGVLVNLVTNALRHTPPGGAVTLCAAPHDGGVALAVTDTGSGIAPEDLARIWERFYQGDKGRDRRAPRGGAGLGLAICRTTVLLLDGRISVESQPGVGTTFTVWLPLRGGAS